MKNNNEIFQTVILSIEETTTFFYQQKDKEGYEKLNESLAAIGLAMDVIHKLSAENEQFVAVGKKINGYLNDAMEALTMKDSILLADILLYEIAKQFKEAKHQ